MLSNSDLLQNNTILNLAHFAKNAKMTIHIK